MILRGQPFLKFFRRGTTPWRLIQTQCVTVEFSHVDYGIAGEVFEAGCRHGRWWLQSFIVIVIVIVVIFFGRWLAVFFIGVTQEQRSSRIANLWIGTQHFRFATSNFQTIAFRFSALVFRHHHLLHLVILSHIILLILLAIIIISILHTPILSGRHADLPPRIQTNIQSQNIHSPLPIHPPCPIGIGPASHFDNGTEMPEYFQGSIVRSGPGVSIDETFSEVRLIFPDGGSLGGGDGACVGGEEVLADGGREGV
mmetsp:Transcript_20606/g.42470  ORF Transcript_20606/g.42470 Transcript_20606/m.42470 type:complete len:254 (-) Transcript_20606:262-1023(-)